MAMKKALVLFSIFGSGSATADIYLVTGATGGTGSLIYQQLVDNGYETRALVTSVEKAVAVLNCSMCDESEGIFVGDVTNASSLEPAMNGVRFLAIAVGVGAESPKEQQQDVEWHGVENQVSALAQNAQAQNRSLTSLGVALISSMGTTNQHPFKFEGGSDLFWKLQGEAFLATSGLPFTIVKPCGLVDGTAASARLVAGHDDYLLTASALKVNGISAIARADVARVLLRALTTDDWRMAGLRFDLCAATNGLPTSESLEDLDHVLTTATWPWAR